MEFTCSTCGQVHEGVADLAFAEPHYYSTVPESERVGRAILTSDLCMIDNEDFFIRGCLEIPIRGSSDVFTWGVWCSVSHTNFERYREVFTKPRQSGVGPFFGWFASRLPGYPDTLLLKVRAHLRDSGTRPRFELQESAHPLFADHRVGITMDRLAQIYEANLHAGRKTG